ncbi:hypothetical protein Sjap_013496 [Stephania japonica]|uniref:Uncharacterized protein n=1 Tax=Stephania japonica TaxID=461633 RepID=A0AAP0NZ60_9MAGN
MEKISLKDDEEDELIRDGNGREGNEPLANLCLVGRFHTCKIINFQAMKNRITSLWHPIQGMMINPSTNRGNGIPGDYF